MIAKSLIAAAALAAAMSVGLPAAEAEAKTSVSINIGLGVGGYRHYHHGYYGYRQPSHIPCWKGRGIVDRSGFRNVKAVDCGLPGYKYTAWRGGHKFLVKVNGYGAITGVNRMF